LEDAAADQLRSASMIDEWLSVHQLIAGKYAG